MGFWFLHKHAINVVNSVYSPEFIIVKINFLLVNVERENLKSLIKVQVALPQPNDCGVTFYYKLIFPSAGTFELIHVYDISLRKFFDHSLFFKRFDIKELRILRMVCVEQSSIESNVVIAYLKLTTLCHHFVIPSDSIYYKPVRVRGKS